MQKVLMYSVFNQFLKNLNNNLYPAFTLARGNLKTNLMNTEYQQLKFKRLNKREMRLFASIQLMNQFELLDIEKGKRKPAKISSIVCIN